MRKSRSRLPLRNSDQRRLIVLELGRSDSDKPPEHSGEVAWIRKSRDSGRVHDCALWITQRNLRSFDSLLQYITVRCATHASLEQLRKVVSLMPANSARSDRLTSSVRLSPIGSRQERCSAGLGAATLRCLTRLQPAVGRRRRRATTAPPSNPRIHTRPMRVALA